MKPEGAGNALRIDRLLVYLRLARTRSAALALIDTHALRRNRKHVQRGSELARIGDVLTLMVGGHVRVIELISIPHRRGPPAEARSCYREVDVFGVVDAFGKVDGDSLDRKGQITIAASPRAMGNPPGDPEDRL